MKRIQYIYTLLLGALMFASCGNEDVPGGDNKPGGIDLADDEIAISYSPKSYVTVTGKPGSIKSIGETRNITALPADENEIENIYILMFGGDVKRYYTKTATFSDGAWDKTSNNVKIKLPQSKAGQRDVYVIANVSADVKSDLDGVTNLTGLQGVLESKSEPWSGTGATNLKHPILMSGMKSHNFVTQGRVLSSVELIRAFAKVELNVTLPTKHQSTNEADYKYNFVDFDKNTYVLEKTNKVASIGTTGWKPFTSNTDGDKDFVSEYTKTGDAITSLKIVTYINETTNANSYIEIQLPYEDGGFLPPPEFGPETFILPRQGKIERNHWYKYDVEL